MSNFWDDRYKQKEFAYGKEANEYLKQMLPKYEPGKILFPAEGEGRNAVYAAQLGWQVSAFDLSLEGKKKAEYLANINQVKIDYRLGTLEELNYQQNYFDAVAFIFAHFPAQIKGDYYTKIGGFLKKDGIIILEVFSKNHIQYQKINPNIGGPQDVDILFSIDEVKLFFPNYEIIELVEKEVNLSEGSCHNGLGSVIRFVGKKNDL
ncbi:MAG: class I SAM-dependent methyltransferase [Sphingobacteriales bacterium]|nr:class I SAM-dependent methyltransferase [Sphingobacteriales bacterium]